MSKLTAVEKLLREAICERFELVRQRRVHNSYAFLTDRKEMAGLSCRPYSKRGHIYRITNQSANLKLYGLGQVVPTYEHPYHRFELTFHESEAGVVFPWVLNSLYGIKGSPDWFLPHPELDVSVGEPIPVYSWTAKGREMFDARNQKQKLPKLR